MRWTRPLLAVALLVSAAGCLSGQELASQSQPSDPPTDRGLATPPDLQVGEWWNVTVEDRLEGETYEVTLVVADGTAEFHELGMPADRFERIVLPLHAPAIGRVDRDTLGYQTHDVLFEPVRFPLEEGRRWTTEWDQVPLQANVTRVESGSAQISLQATGSASLEASLTYVPELGLPASFSIPGVVAYEVEEHGYGYEGTVEVPLGRDVVFLEGRIGPAVSFDLEPAGPTGSVDVADGYDRMTLAQLVGNLFVDGPPGLYRERAQAPRGTTYELQTVPTPGDPLRIETYTVDDPSGTWTFRHVSGGPGAALSEGIAYDVETARLSS